ncbi:nectin-3 isoform b [Plakobranchus ocellatus]|uniref:Nectin-3 isoform b n=1 Tax=Plakobranchus ocellatus TaxID=259542 RepID=A0AAV4D827_9GAST|nr:nectin-3 isoform b [Plakobranchus ocellatus]
MGLLNFYISFIPNFSDITRPLTELVRKDLPDRVVSSDECQTAFKTICSLLSSDPILVFPDMDSPFVVRTDAPDYGVGAVLLQPRDDVLMPCRYASKKLSPAEMNYSSIERECLAIVYAVNQTSFTSSWLFGILSYKQITNL